MAIQMSCDCQEVASWLNEKLKLQPLFIFVLTFPFSQENGATKLDWGMVCTGGEVLRELFDNIILPLLSLSGFTAYFAHLCWQACFFLYPTMRTLGLVYCLLSQVPRNPVGFRFYF